MARIRTIKPEFWTDEKVVGISAFARLVFIGLWNFVDDYGRAPYSPVRIKMQILPADHVDFPQLLAEISGADLITIYDVDGKQFFQVNGFEKHQKIDKRAKSKCPDPPIPAESPRKSPMEGIKEWIKEGIKEEEIRGAEAPEESVVPIRRYAFEGRTVRLEQKHFDQWQKVYHAIPDFTAALQAADDYYSEHPPKDGKWFFPVSRWLEKQHTIEFERRKVSEASAMRARGEAW